MATIRNRGPHQYQALVRQKGYPTLIRTFETKKEAEAWAKEQESKMDQGLFRDRREAEHTTLHDALQRYLEQVTVHKRGRKAEENRIRMFQEHPLAQRSMGSLQAKDFATYRDQRVQEVSNNTVRLELALLSHLYTVAIKEWCFPIEHELKNIRKPKPGAARERRLVDDEEARLLQGAKEIPSPKLRFWLTACIRIGISTGMRAGEILSLDWKQVNLTRRFIKLEQTKNGNTRIVPLNPDALGVLEALPKTITGKVIPHFYDTPALDNAFKKACVAAGIQDLVFHDLRHEAASRLAPHIPVQTLAKVMGWKTLQMAMRYYNPTEDELVRAVTQPFESGIRSAA